MRGPVMATSRTVLDTLASKELTDPDAEASANSKSGLLDLGVFKLDRCGAAEDRHRDLDARTRVVDFLDGAVERGKRPVRNAHLLADFERHRRLGPLNAFLHLMQNAIGFGFREEVGVDAYKL